MAGDSSVALPRVVVVGAAVALVALLAAVAFLAGQKSVQPAPAIGLAPRPEARPVVAQPPGGSPATAPAGEPGAAAVEAPEAVAIPTPPSGTERSRTSASTAAPATTAAEAAERQAVARYFEDTEEIQRKGKTWNDPENFARSLVGQGANGDASGFDELLASNRRVRDALQSQTVPNLCVEHHRLTLALMEETLELLDQLKQSTLRHDESGLLALATRGKAIEARAREVDALAATLKRRLGL